MTPTTLAVRTGVDVIEAGIRNPFIRNLLGKGSSGKFVKLGMGALIGYGLKSSFRESEDKFHQSENITTNILRGGAGVITESMFWASPWSAFTDFIDKGKMATAGKLGKTLLTLRGLGIGLGLELVKTAFISGIDALVGAGAQFVDKMIERGSRMSQFRTSQITFNNHVAGSISTAMGTMQEAYGNYALGFQNRASRLHRKFASIGF